MMPIKFHALACASLLLLFHPVLEAAEPCLQRHGSTRLATLRVETCLLARPGAEETPAIATSIRQEIRNVSAKPISIQVFDDPLWRSGIEIYSGSKSVSRGLPDPMSGSREQWPTFTYRRLEPGASLEFDYEIAQLLKEPAREKSEYTIAINTDFAYRFFDEPEGREYQLRHEEELLRNEMVVPGWFFNVRLR